MIRALTRRLADERGYSLVELVTVAALIPVVLGAVLTTATGFSGTVQRNQELNESQQRTRSAVDQLARDLRNLASPTNELPEAVDKADPYDIVFQTVDHSPGNGQNLANIRRVRYCLDAPSSGPATLWSQVQTWTTAVAPLPLATLQCPDPSWGNQRRMALGLTNRIGTPRPLFQFNSTDRRQVSAITIQAWLRAANGRDPALGVLRSQVFLRNQNETPVADFDWKTTSPGHVLLNGSASADPEGDELSYSWYLDSSNTPTSGVVFDLQTTAGPHLVTLKVRDPAGLEGTMARTVTVL